MHVSIPLQNRPSSQLPSFAQPGKFMNDSLPPLAKLCTWIPIRSDSLPKSNRRSLNVIPGRRSNVIPNHSPGSTPLGATGASESAENPADVSNGGTALLPPGRSLGVAWMEKLTPGWLSSISAMPRRAPSSK